MATSATRLFPCSKIPSGNWGYLPRSSLAAPAGPHKRAVSTPIQLERYKQKRSGQRVLTLSGIRNASHQESQQVAISSHFDEHTVRVAYIRALWLWRLRTLDSHPTVSLATQHLRRE